MTDWQPIEGWPQYEVARAGELRKATGAPVGQWLSSTGYKMARLSNPRAMKRVHRLVAQAFVPNPEGKPCVNHINNDPTDNRAENLEWCTQYENIAHSARQGRQQRDYWVGRRSPNASLTDAAVRALRARYAAGGTSLEAVGREFGVSKSVAKRCVNLETYSDVR